MNLIDGKHCIVYSARYQVFKIKYFFSYYSVKTW